MRPREVGLMKMQINGLITPCLGEKIAKRREMSLVKEPGEEAGEEIRSWRGRPGAGPDLGRRGWA